MIIVQENKVYQVNIDIGSLLWIKNEIINNCSQSIIGTDVGIDLRKPQMHFPKERGYVKSIEYKVLDPQFKREQDDFIPSYYCDWTYIIFPNIVNLIDKVVFMQDEEALKELIDLVSLKIDATKIKTPEEESFYYEDIRALINIEPVEEQAKCDILIKRPIRVRIKKATHIKGPILRK